jgi:hypothetical protein
MNHSFMQGAKERAAKLTFGQLETGISAPYAAFAGFIGEQLVQAAIENFGQRAYGTAAAEAGIAAIAATGFVVGCYGIYKGIRDWHEPLPGVPDPQPAEQAQSPAQNSTSE